MKTLLMLGLAVFLGFSGLGKETNSPAPEELKHPSDFQFEGGNLYDFLSAVHKAFGVDLKTIGTVPDTMFFTVMVPKLRMNLEAERARLSLRSILYLYNNISEKGQPTMGRWIMEPATGEPQTILLVPTGPGAESSFAVRAFSLPSSNPQDTKRLVDLLQSTIQSQQDLLLRSGEYIGISERDLRGGLNFHGSTGILVASGGKGYVEMASSIIEAYKEQMKEKMRQADIPVPVITKPEKP